jgi:hypothetical protein
MIAGAVNVSDIATTMHIALLNSGSLKSDEGYGSYIMNEITEISFEREIYF